jgi:hypothetical protein
VCWYVSGATRKAFAGRERQETRGDVRQVIGEKKRRQIGKRRQDEARCGKREARGDETRGERQGDIKLRDEMQGDLTGKSSDGFGLVSRCPCRNAYESYIRTSGVTAPHHQAVSPKGAYRCFEFIQRISLEVKAIGCIT